MLPNATSPQDKKNRLVNVASLFLALTLWQSCSLSSVAQTSDTPTTPVVSTNSSDSNAAAASNSSGSTINQQQNTQVNNSNFVGFGPGIQCPITNVGVSGYVGQGNGGTGDSTVDTTSYGLIGTINIPIGAKNKETCAKLGEAQLGYADALTVRTGKEAAKIQTDITLVTINNCIQILKSATLSGKYAEVCDGIILRP